STGAQYQLELARLAPERVAGAVFIGPLFPYTPSQYSVLLDPRALAFALRPSPLHVYRWWGRMSPLHWRESYPEFARWYVSRCCSTPHSTKGVEDAIGWMLETDPETLAATVQWAFHRDRRTLRALARNLDCPVLVIHGERDRVVPPRDGRAL